MSSFSSSHGLHAADATRKLPRWQVRCAAAVAGSALVALCAHVAVPLPFTPVPFTLQPFAVLLVGMLLGPVAGCGAMLAYLMEGAIGLPVFTPMGAPGLARLLGPTGGYLLAYPLAAVIAGWLPRIHAARGRFWTFVAGGAIAMIVVYVCGAVWFSHLLSLPFGSALTGAVTPFAASDGVKVLAAASMAAAVRQHRARATK